MYSTDNGPHMNSWPDAGMTPFRNEKNSNWEGAYRVPAMVRWPGHIPAGQTLNGIVSHNDWFVTLLAAAGDTDIADRLKAGTELDGTTYKAHLDGFNHARLHHRRVAQRARVSTSSTSPTTATSRRCATTTGSSCSSSSARRARSTSGPSRTPSCACRGSSTSRPIRTSGPSSPRTRTTTGCSTTSFCFVPAQTFVLKMSQTLMEFPPSQEPASFTINKVMAEAAGRCRQQLTGRLRRACVRDTGRVPGGNVHDRLRRPLRGGGAGPSVSTSTRSRSTPSPSPTPASPISWHRPAT